MDVKRLERARIVWEYQASGVFDTCFHQSVVVVALYAGRADKNSCRCFRSAAPSQESGMAPD